MTKMATTPIYGKILKKYSSLKPSPLIQEEQLSVNGERMCAKYWLTANETLAQEQCG